MHFSSRTIQQTSTQALAGFNFRVSEFCTAYLVVNASVVTVSGSFLAQ
jgi:hypothetical protein